MKDDHAVILDRLEKESTELKEKEVFAKESTVKDYKASDDFGYGIGNFQIFRRGIRLV